MAAAISLQGIDEAISNLNYRSEKALKYRLIHIIRGYYENENSVESIQEIDTDELVKALWNTGDDPKAIKSKRKNLSSIRSSINNDLKRLYEDGKNTEGISIGPNNIFMMSDEAKEKLLATFTSHFATGEKGDRSVSLGQIAEVLNVVSEVLSSPETLADADSPDGLSKLEQLRNIIRGLSRNLGIEVEEGTLSNEVTGASGTRVVEKHEEGVQLLETGTEEDSEEAQEKPGGDHVIEAGPEGYGPDTKGGESGGEQGVGPEKAGDTEKIEQNLEEAEVAEDLEEAEIKEDLEEAEEVEEDLEEVEDDVEEAEVEEDLEEAEIAEELEEAEVEEVAVEEDLEEAEEVEEDLEEAEIAEDVEKADVEEGLEEAEVVEGLEEVELAEGFEASGLTVGDLERQSLDSNYEEKEKIQQAKLLAEQFNAYLSARDRYYNQYILIPEGDYLVGSKMPKNDEQLEHKVHLMPFYMGKFPVTNTLFEIFVEKTGYRTTAERLGYSTVYHGRFQETVDEETGLVTSTCNAAISCKTVQGACWYQPTGPGSTLHNKRNHPVVQVSLEDAIAFAAWTGKRLPTEDEWEAAARTADGYVLPWGNDWKRDSCNIEESAIADTTPVDKYIEFENEFGIVDTIGNVVEWTLTTCEPPPHVENRAKYYIIKGGSWISGNDIRLFSRFKWDAESPSNILGFRCVAY
ncbi:MAG: SUMF1/EgtB/PvdO family nonheme iron enzyme [Deltaproteobacteria bacterium]|nr:SUMF1/EgtB/PvdO family nonheme iron enzyme [Deltaproteobacteria bacterium]MBW2018439.1 SUMF1/EgtB/PvdO family nonheme iron enzyme [Deltaproteobacteria bacterium]MBW2073726.1 SUMF1/EgtB/PvdO family nonheme iron enzyme [Deltaproteobacteria bacterium]